MHSCNLVLVLSHILNIEGCFASSRIIAMNEPISISTVFIAMAEVITLFLPALVFLSVSPLLMSLLKYPKRN